MDEFQTKMLSAEQVLSDPSANDWGSSATLVARDSLLRLSLLAFSIHFDDEFFLGVPVQIGHPNKHEIER